MSIGELTIYDRIDNPIHAVETLGKAIAESGIFGCSNAAQGFVLAWECLTARKSALGLAKENHLISNKLSMKADAMLAMFDERGGKHVILERTPDRVAIELVDRHDAAYQMSLTWEEAQAEPFPYSGKESEILSKLAAGQKPELKPKYATPRSRMQMLWARLVSDAIRAIDPGVNFGQYAPEEIEDEDGEQEPKPVRTRKSAKQVIQEASETTPTKPADDDVIDGSFEIAKDEPTTFSLDVTGPCTAEQVSSIKSLIAEVEQLQPGVTQKIKDVLTSAGLQKIVDLSFDEARTLEQSLRVKNLEAFFNAKLQGFKPGN